MKIATWNIERLQHYKKINSIIQEIVNCNADILILTETDSRIKLDYPYYYHISSPINDMPVIYADTENRVAIFSRYKCATTYKPCDKYTSVCVEFETEKGNLVVYGTIMGVLGNRYPGFKKEICEQMEDIKRISSTGKSVCVVVDYNLSFCDNYYYTKFGRDLVNSTFAECGISILSKNCKECIDHIAVSDKFFAGLDVFVSEWNTEKTLSDHKGIMVNIV